MVSIDGYPIDALISVDPQHTVEATRFPIENGSEMTDHIIRRPTMIYVEGVVTDTPIGAVSRARTSAAQSGADTSVLPSNDAYALLVGILNAARRVDIVSDVYPPFTGCVLLSISAPKTEETGEAFVFRATFQVVETVSINIEDTTTLVSKPRAKKKKKDGAQAGKDAEVPEKTTNKYNNDTSHLLRASEFAAPKIESFLGGLGF